MKITREELLKQKAQLTIFLIITSLILCLASYRVKQLKKEINRLEADYIILLETCKGHKQ